MEGEKTFLQKLKTFLPCFTVIGLVTLSVGIVFLCTSHGTVVTKDFIQDYTNCTMADIGEEETETCLEYMKENNDTCVCFIYFNLTNNFQGDVTFYYELETYNQQRSDYVNSRDNNQLNGIINLEPSESCEPYRYDSALEGNKPIAPCGAIANYMFTDTFRLRYSDTELGTIVPTKTSGMLSDEDKIGFRNPKNMSAVMQNFTKPIMWDRNIWELDSVNPDNNGFQNEYFISWMKTEWKRKPWAVVNKTDEKFQHGLPEGQYELRIGYRYPAYIYDGPRKFIITSKQIHYNEEWFLCGIVATVIGAIFSITAIGLIFWDNRNNKKLAMHQDVTRPLRSS